ncbi:hypothetical protein KIW84_011147 [Lathyrus oleraceus]|nr:hypothetical protein KIW84_011147 [Pisum sativum]
MGNNLEGVNRLSKGNFPSYHEQLGSYGSLDVTKIEHEAVNGHTNEVFDMMKWNATYTIDSSKCILDLRTVSNKDGKINSVSFQVSDEMYSDGNIWFAVLSFKHAFIFMGVEAREVFLCWKRRERAETMEILVT